jgi:hypothetical protein
VRAQVKRLWRGEESLPRAFWEYALLYGTLANLATTGAMLAAVAADLPALLALAIYLTPLPYNMLMVVAVWRSAARYRGRPEWATLARIAIVVWAVIATAA